MNEELTDVEIDTAKRLLEEDVLHCFPREAINRFMQSTGIAITHITFDYLDVTCKADGKNRKSVPGLVHIGYESRPCKS